MIYRSFCDGDEFSLKELSVCESCFTRIKKQPCNAVTALETVFQSSFFPAAYLNFLFVCFGLLGRGAPTMGEEGSFLKNSPKVTGDRTITDR